MRIRVASARDRRAIAAFCRREDPDDYVPDWMDRFLSEGRFFLLTDGKGLAGLVHGKRAPDGSAWLSAARIHHKYRGHGWINRLNDAALASPWLKDAHAARMLITASNASSIRAAEKGGYAVASRITILEWDAPMRTRKARRPSDFVRVSAVRAARDAANSPVIAAQDGLAYMPFTGAFAPRRPPLESKQEWLYRSPRAGLIMCAFFPDEGEKWLAAQPFRATSTAAEASLEFAVNQGAASMTVALPDAPRFKQPFLKAGFVNSPWARHVRIFERRLRGRAPTPSRGRRPAAR